MMGSVSFCSRDRLEHTQRALMIRESESLLQKVHTRFLALADSYGG